MPVNILLSLNINYFEIIQNILPPLIQRSSINIKWKIERQFNEKDNLNSIVQNLITCY